MASIFKTLNEGYIKVTYLNLAGSLGFISNALGRIGFGVLFDLIGFKKAYFIVLTI